MPKLKYAGAKSGPVGETAFASETGITWFPGTVKNVSDALAQRMLQHPDVFALAGDKEPESDGDATAEAIEQPAPAVVVQQADEDEKLTPAQRRIAAFAAADAAGDTPPVNPTVIEPGAQTQDGPAPVNPVLLAPGSTVAQATELAPGMTVAQSAPVAAKKAAPAKKSAAKAKGK